MQKLTQNQLDDLTAEMHEYMETSGRKNFPAAKADELREMGAKRCGRCKEVKNLEAFNKKSSTRDGLQALCKTCTNAAYVDYHAANREKRIEYFREYREQNRERLNEYFREYNAVNREQRNEYHRTRYRTDEHHRMRMQLNDGYHRAVRAGNPAEWVTPEELLTYWSAKGIPALECYLTSEELTPQNRSLDHVVSIGNGGSHSVANLMPCTFEANQRKANLEPDEAKQLLSND